jgi:hypothetical protein
MLAVRQSQPTAYQPSVASALNTNIILVLLAVRIPRSLKSRQYTLLAKHWFHFALSPDIVLTYNGGTDTRLSQAQTVDSPLHDNYWFLLA